MEWRQSAVRGRSSRHSKEFALFSIHGRTRTSDEVIKLGCWEHSLLVANLSMQAVVDIRLGVWIVLMLRQRRAGFPTSRTSDELTDARAKYAYHASDAHRIDNMRSRLTCSIFG